MARRKPEHEKLEDIFFDMTPEEQAETLRVLTRLHGIAERQQRRAYRELPGGGPGNLDTHAEPPRDV